MFIQTTLFYLLQPMNPHFPLSARSVPITIFTLRFYIWQGEKYCQPLSACRNDAVDWKLIYMNKSLVIQARVFYHYFETMALFISSFCSKITSFTIHVHIIKEVLLKDKYWAGMDIFCLFVYWHFRYCRESHPVRSRTFMTFRVTLS